jgi:hypothetical protein
MYCLVGLQEPGTLVNEVKFKTLGFLPGYSRQYGQIQPLTGDTFVVSCCLPPLAGLICASVGISGDCTGISPFHQHLLLRHNHYSTCMACLHP